MNDGVAEVFDWYFSGDVEIPMPIPTPELTFRVSAPDADHLSGPTYGQPQWMTTLWVRLQHANLTLSSDAIQVIAHSGHVLQQDDPPAVVEGARELVAAVHTGAPLPCRGPWSSVGGTCR